MKTLIMYSFAMVVATVFGVLPLVAQSAIYSITSPVYTTLTGRVTDKEGKGLVGATVIVEGTKKGAKTKADGKFMFSGLQKGTYTLRVSFVGFKKKIVELNLNDSTHLGEIHLESEMIQVTECIIYASSPEYQNNRCVAICRFNSTNCYKEVANEEFQPLDIPPTLFPNPASNYTTARYNADDSGYAEIEVYTTNGSRVLFAKYLAVKGSNELPVDVSQLPAGQYFVRISTTNRTEVVPLNIVR